MAQSNITKLGRSLPVPSVQELAREPLNRLPSQYLRPDFEPSIVSTAALHQVPVIDMQKLISGDNVDFELDNFHQGCQEWGFFQLINHRVNKSLVENMKTQLQGLFNLSMEEKKKKLWQEPGSLKYVHWYWSVAHSPDVHLENFFKAPFQLHRTLKSKLKMKELSRFGLMWRCYDMVAEKGVT